MSLSLERLVRNQVLFREVNERLAEVAPPSYELTEYVCECSRGDCTAAIPLDREQYEGIRSLPNLFVVAAGHEVLEVDHVVGRTGVYTLVEKKPNGAKLAAQTDPRARQQRRD
jgi:hypothetical protein